MEYFIVLLVEVYLGDAEWAGHLAPLLLPPLLGGDARIISPPDCKQVRAVPALPLIVHLGGWKVQLQWVLQPT